MRMKLSHSLIMFILGPFIFMSVYLLISRWPIHWFTEISDYVAFIISMAIGLTGLVFLPALKWKKIILAVIYFPLASIAMFYGGFMFVCFIFGDCL